MLKKLCYTIFKKHQLNEHRVKYFPKEYIRKMNRMEYFNYIEEKLNILSYRIKSRAKMNILDLNLHSENFFRDLFNLIYDTDFENLNNTKQNVAGIDLIDEENQIVAQVTSKVTKEKIENSLSKDIFKNSYHGYTFWFIAFTNDADELRKKQYTNPYELKFDPKDNVYDVRSILKDIENFKIKKMKAVYDFVKDELGAIELENLRKELMNSEMGKNRDLAESYRNRWADPMFLNPKGSSASLSLKELYDGVDGYQLPRAEYKEAGKYKEEYRIESAKLKSVLIDELDEQVEHNTPGKNLLILGLPGIGKSTLVTWFCNAYHKREIIAFSMAKLSHGKSEAERIDKDTIFKKINIQEEDLQNKILILDGLDEVSNIRNKVQFINNLFYDLQDICGLSIIITCRVNYIEPNELSKADFPYAILQPWDSTQIKNFTERYCRKINIPVKEETLDVMCKEEKADLYGIPLIAYMIVATGTDITNASSETDVFERLFSITEGILAYQIDSHYYGRPRSLDDETKRNILDLSRRMAFWIFENNPDQGDIDIDSFRRICSQYNLRNTDQIYMDFFKQIHYIEGKQRIQFAHRTFYEYFVADYLATQLFEKKAASENEKEYHLSDSQTLARKLANFGKKGLIEDSDLNKDTQLAEFIREKLRRAFSQHGFIGSDGLTEEAYFWFEEGVAELIKHGMTHYAYFQDDKQKIGNSLNEEMICAYNVVMLLEDVYSFYRGENGQKQLMFEHSFSDEYFRKMRDGYLRLISSYLHRGIRLDSADLRFADLRSADLYSVNLSFADLRSADLRSANLSFGNLQSAKVNSANLHGANLSSSNLNNSNLDAAYLHSANLSSAKLQSAQLHSADVSDANLSDTDLSNSNLSNVKLSNSNLRGANLSNANLQSVDFNNANIDNARLTTQYYDSTIMGYKENFPNDSIGYAKFENIIVDDKNYTRHDFFNKIAGSSDYLGI